MTPTETAAILRRYNEWRLGDEYLPQPDTEQITAAIYAAVEMIERLEVAESEAIEQARLNGMGSEREAALMAKLEVAEKEREELRAVARHESDCVDACMQEIDALKEEAARLRGGLALIADQYEPKCSLLIPSIARTALNATGAYGQKEPPESWPTEAMVTAFAELFNVRDQKNTFGPAFRAALAAAAAPEAKP